MAWDPSIFSLLGVGAAGICALLAAQAWRNRTQRGARSFVWLMVALGGWSLVYGIQLGFSIASNQLFWQRVALAIGGAVPTLWIVFTLYYLGHDEWLTRRVGALLAIDPILFALLTLTNPVHELIWYGNTLVPTPAGPILNLSLAGGYYVHIWYAYVLIALGLGLFFRVFERATQIYRKQTGFLILGVLPPFAGNVTYTFRLSWGPLPALDPTPFLFVLTGVLWALALYQFDLLDRTPLARERIIDEMGDGLVVLDGNREVVNANPVATRVFDPDPEVGRPIAKLLPENTGDAETPLARLDGQTITARVDGHQRAYDLEWSSLTDHQGATIGHMLALRDVTERNEYQQRLEVAQRVLRHNLRNDMNVIQIWAERLAETTDQTDAAERISETADGLIDLSEKAKTMVQMEPAVSTRRTDVDVGRQLTGLLEEFEKTHPDVTIECTVPNAVDASLPGERFLLIPVENLVENAIEHNDATEPWVRVSVESAGGEVTVRVADNGPTIPEMERTVLEEGIEDSLHHGSGLGLWLAHWSVEAVGGTIGFDEREPRGNVVTLEFPAAR